MDKKRAKVTVGLVGIPDLVEFEIVEHTADWAIRVRGPDLPGLLISAAWGMNSLLVADPETIPNDVQRRLELEAFDRESMLVEWLTELAYLAERDSLLFREFVLERATPTELIAIVRGGPVPQLQKHVKAVTYHNLEVVETAEGLEATVVLDV